MRRFLLALMFVGVGLWNHGHAQNSCRCYRGLYVGWNFGYAFHDHVWTDRDDLVSFFDSGGVGSITTTSDGATFGVCTGYNLQCGCVLLGVEFDASWANLDNKKDHLRGVATHLNLRNRLNYFGTARARAGIIAKDLLFFSTMGAAWGNFKNHWRIEDPLAIFETEDHVVNRSRRGLALGAGIEWIYCSLFSIKLEALYFRFPETTHHVFSSNLASDFRFDLTDKVWMARIGFNYKLCALFY
jgi:outer membrane immunogenic protein